MPTRYLVLRSDMPFHDVLAGVPVLESSRAGHTGLRPGLTIETFDGQEKDGGALREDPRSAAVMDADVLFALIEPKSEGTSTAEPESLLVKAGTQRVTAGLPAVGATTSAFTGQGVTVAVLDTGADVTHPAFAGLTIAARNFTDEGLVDDVRDENGHGTHCAATVCGRVVGDVRVGVATGVTKLCLGKVLKKDRRGTLEMLLKAMFWAVFEQKAAVVSISLSFDLPGNAARLQLFNNMDPASATAVAMRQQAEIIKGIDTLRQFLESQSPAVVFVAATGNESLRPHRVLPAGLPATQLLPVGAVGAISGGWGIAEFSNSRAQVVAPGVDVVSAAVGGGWTTMSGTSMATPHVAGVAALWVEKLRNEGSLGMPAVVRTMLTTTARRPPIVDGDIDSIGYGMVQAPVA